ncbi:MAG TPA: hypothetical protein DIW47_01035 [Bacteroidetes bacterium]|nr:hypothetical protein [Bacteroidota bacterium]
MLKKLSRSLLLLCVAIAASSFVLHKFYISHYTLEYKTQTLQVTVKVFTDDLEKALKQTDPSIKIDENSDPEVLGPKILAYYNKHLQIKSNTALNFQWVGYELENDLVWIYLEVPALAAAPKSLEISCTALTEIYEDQINLFRVDCGELKETFSLRKDESLRQLGD